MYVLVADDNLAVDLPDEDRIDLFRAQSLDDCPKLAAFTFPVCGIAIERVRAQVGIDANPDAPANCVRHRTQRAGFPQTFEPDPGSNDVHFPGNGGEHVQQKCVVLTRVPKLADARALRSEVAALTFFLRCYRKASMARADAPQDAGPLP